MLQLQPATLRQANAFVAEHHRHSKPVRGQKWSVAVANGSGVCGFAIAGQVRARALEDGFTIEIYRNCTDGTKNACSKLYAAVCRAARGMGYRKAITYTLASESGASLRAAGFVPVGEVKDRQWGCASRPREERDLVGDKVRWERRL